jgi:NAD(P)-dependent dehydrogenase (short-subunit alcohol dehydrogenase family)
MVEHRLAGKVAIVTGASRGLGQYCAVNYGREGAAVVIAARTEQEKNPDLPGTIHATARLVEQAGGEAYPVACNVADLSSVAFMVDQVMSRYGQVDVLMNNAGIVPPGNNSTIELRHWELEFRVNVHGPFYCTRAVLPHMAQRGGSVINISSYGSLSGTHYGATKRALEAMTVGFAEEQRGNGIAVNALKPLVSIETPGMFFPGGGVAATPGRAVSQKPDRYVEAAVLLALQTPDSCTGQIFDDAQAVLQLGDAGTKARFAGEEWQQEFVAR